MSNFSISDITPTGALYNAMAAARESDRRAARSRPSTSVETAKLASATIWNVLGDILRHIGQAYRTGTA